MAKTQPARAGASRMPSDLEAARAQLAAAELALAETPGLEIDHEQRAAHEEQLDELRVLVRDLEQQERLAELAAVESANYVRSHEPPSKDEPAAETPSSGQE